MTREQAFELAREIDANPPFKTAAVGYFVPVEHLPAATKWGVSVLTKEGKVVVCWTREGWLKLSGVDSGPRRDAKHREQLSLF